MFSKIALPPILATERLAPPPTRSPAPALPEIDVRSISTLAGDPLARTNTPSPSFPET